jgi:uncharacterized surface protein with fasciclin (FAS1) repeats
MPSPSRDAVVASAITAMALVAMTAFTLVSNPAIIPFLSGTTTTVATGSVIPADHKPAVADPVASRPAGSQSAASQPAVASDLVGPGCAAYAAQVPQGSGSIVGMAQDPVAVAASNNPLLTTLVAAVSGKVNPKVNLVDTLDGSEFTVFAPIDSAFAKLPASTLATLSKPQNAETLSSILTYHVVPGQLLPADVDGVHTTVEGQTLTVTGSGNSLTVNGARVVCGGVHTANATVYLIDTVLLPRAKK